MKRIFIFTAICAAALMVSSCVIKKDETKMWAIQDSPGMRMMASAIFPDAPESLVADLGFENGVPSAICAYFVQRDGANLLFDAGNGGADSRLIPELEKIGIAPEDIDVIFLTHMHGDHTGGMLDEGKVVFTNAKVYLNKDEYAGLGEGAKENNVLNAYEDQLVLFDASEELPHGITPIKAYGHTSGHTMYSFDNIVIAGDIMHGLALQFDHPEICAAFDADKPAAVEARRMVIELVKDGKKVYGMHFPDPHYIKMN